MGIDSHFWKSPQFPLKKDLKYVCDSVENAFALLDTQFGDRNDELYTVKSKITDKEMLPLNYDFEMQIGILKDILRYHSIFNR